MEGPTDSKQTDSRSVSDAYTGKSIFVTGGTGFLGKVFIEKILYECPKISNVYVLVRKSPNITVDERIRKMLAMPVFDRLRAVRPQDLNKIVPLTGDIALPKLGLLPEDEETLVKTVSMVFHIAATTRFNEALQKALKINFIGTKRILQLCKQIPNIEALIYVSTAYSNPYLDIIEERLYPPLISLEEAELLVERPIISEEEQAKILGSSFNTYTFTKGLAENYIETHQGAVPTAIIRPSIVIASKVEPVVGWVDHWSIATYSIVTIAEGVARAMFTNSNHTIDLIPVDYVANTAIVAAAKLKRTKEIHVYNICSSSENPITMQQLLDTSIDIWIKNKWNKVPYPSVLLTESRWTVNMIFLLQKLCAIIADWLLYLLGKQTRFVKQQRILSQFRNPSDKFVTRTWKIRAEKTCALYECLSDTDQKHFDFNPRNIVWPELLADYMKGVRKYLYKSRK